MREFLKLIIQAKHSVKLNTNSGPGRIVSALLGSRRG